jgi:GDP-D-mannose 3',5'-epimerase
MSKKFAVVLGAGGFIGGHLVKQLRSEGYYVRGVDIKEHVYNKCPANEFIIGDLRNYELCDDVIDNGVDEVYQLAADMGGAEYVFTGENDANIMSNSCLININICNICVAKNVKKVFYSSSACIYPEHNQLDPSNPMCSEDSAYPAAPDSEYGWEKLFSERLYLAYSRNYNLDVHIARFHNIYGPYGVYAGGKEKAPAALCRKVAECDDHGTIKIIGDGRQTRSFLYIDDCIIGIRQLMKSNHTGPFNIGSEEMISINDFAKMIIQVSGKTINIRHITGPTGVRGRNSDNNLVKDKLNWGPQIRLYSGIERLYNWIDEQVHITKQNTYVTDEY